MNGILSANDCMATSILLMNFVILVIRSWQFLLALGAT